VAAGKAIFHLAGKGKLADVELPARGTFKLPARDKTVRQCLIVQAETRPDGSTQYGISERHAVRRAPASAFADVVPLRKLKTGKE
jgi:hypothetical protein